MSTLGDEKRALLLSEIEKFAEERIRAHGGQLGVDGLAMVIIVMEPCANPQHVEFKGSEWTSSTNLDPTAAAALCIGEAKRQFEDAGIHIETVDLVRGHERVSVVDERARVSARGGSS